MVKKISKKQQQVKKTPRTKKQFIFPVLIIILALAAATVLVFQANAFMTTRQNTSRLDRINAIYTSLNLGSEYQVVSQNVFGDKRPYDYDAGRTTSSQIDYERGAHVDVTFSELDKKIRALGFTFIGEPYPGSAAMQYHYKSSKGEYIRLTVSSKVRDDAGRDDILMKRELSDTFFNIDKNIGPSNVTIKVNLDDNNE